MLLHRRPGGSSIGEAQAYAHLHGDRSGAVTIITAEPRLPRYQPRARGEQLRRRFEEMLDKRSRSSRKAAPADEAQALPHLMAQLAGMPTAKAAGRTTRPTAAGSTRRDRFES